MTDSAPSEPRSPPGGRLWLYWVLMSTAGWLVGGLVGSALRPPSGDSAADAVVVAGGVITAGLGQWIVLRGALERAARWVLATAAGLPVVAVLVWIVPPLDWGGGVALGGLALGVLQWLVLRAELSYAGWWIVASAVGWVVGGLLSGATSPPAGWLVIGALYGGITGAALVLLLNETRRRRRSSPPG